MQALENIKVIDLTHVIAGPFAAYQLAVLGADVIKIESPNNPDMVRAEGAKASENQIGMGSMFTAQSGNKRAITLNLKTPEGQEILKRMITTADVLVENYRSGALRELGLGYQRLSEINPRLVYCSLTGYGQSGPKGKHTAYDNVIQAFSGLMASTGFPDSESVKVGPPVLDYGTGAQAALAIVAALFRREHTGKGEHIDVSMLDAAIMLSGINVTHVDSTGQPPKRNGNNSLVYAGYSCYETQDGQLMVGAYTTKQHENLWRALGEEECADEIKNLSNEALSQHQHNNYAALQKIFFTKSATEWEQCLNQHKVPAARVRSADETLADEQLAHRNVVQKVKSFALKKTLQLPVAAYTYTEDGPRLHSPPPGFGEHTGEILEEMGYSPQDLDDMRNRGII